MSRNRARLSRAMVVFTALVLMILSAMPALAATSNSSNTISSVADGAVTTARLASQAVTTAKIKDGTITNADIAAGAAIAASKIDTNTLNADLLDGYQASAFLLKSQPNPNQVALLRWHEAAQADTSFTVGDAPRDVAFDGANVWVANAGSNNVTKISAASESVVGTYTYS